MEQCITLGTIIPNTGSNIIVDKIAQKAVCNFNFLSSHFKRKKYIVQVYAPTVIKDKDTIDTFYDKLAMHAKCSRDMISMS